MVIRPLRKLELIVSLNSGAKRQGRDEMGTIFKGCWLDKLYLRVSLTAKDNQYGEEDLGWDVQEESG